MAEVKDKAVVVTKLTVKVAGKDLNLDIEDAKKLYEALGEIFCNPVVVVQKEFVLWNFPALQPPMVIPWNSPTWITCGAGSSQSGNFNIGLSTEIK